jgi:hypothetical protein
MIEAIPMINTGHPVVGNQAPLSAQDQNCFANDREASAYLLQIQSVLEKWEHKYAKDDNRKRNSQSLGKS